jgi:competence protein ComGC
MKAFTLVETLLYLALFNVVFLSVIGFTIAITQNNRVAEYRNAVDKNTIFVTQHLQDAFSHANAVDAANSVYDTDNGRIRLIQATGYKEYFIENNTLKVTNGLSTYDLSDALASVSKLRVETVLSPTGSQTGARITLRFVSKKYDTVSKEVSTYYDFR